MEGKKFTNLEKLIDHRATANLENYEDLKSLLRFINKALS
jgi:hypothetical protein